MINATLLNNRATGNCRHGYNIVTGTTGIDLINNIAEGNGYCFATSLGNGIMIQTNQGYVTSNAYLSGNTVSQSASDSISLVGVTNILLLDNHLASDASCLYVSGSSIIGGSGNTCQSSTKVIKYFGVNQNLELGAAFV